jgi:hypothetical protein
LDEVLESPFEAAAPAPAPAPRRAAGPAAAPPVAAPAAAPLAAVVAAPRAAAPRAAAPRAAAAAPPVAAAPPPPGFSAACRQADAAHRALPACYSATNQDMNKVIFAAATLYPCIGAWVLSKNGKSKSPDNVAPSKKAKEYQDLIVKECAESQGIGFTGGFMISVSTLKKVIPNKLQAWLEDQERTETASGNGDKDDTSEYDNIMEGLIESLEQQRHSNEEYKNASAEEKKNRDDMDSMATDQRNEGVNGMTSENRSAGPRAAATARAASTRSGIETAWGDDDEGSEDLDAAQIYENQRGVRRAGGGAESSIDKLVKVLASSADAAKEDKVEQRALDSRRIDIDELRVDIEKATEARRNAEHTAKVERDKLQAKPLGF